MELHCLLTWSIFKNSKAFLPVRRYLWIRAILNHQAIIHKRQSYSTNTINYSVSLPLSWTGLEGTTKSHNSSRPRISSKAALEIATLWVPSLLWPACILNSSQKDSYSISTLLSTAASSYSLMANGSTCQLMIDSPAIMARSYTQSPTKMKYGSCFCRKHSPKSTGRTLQLNLEICRNHFFCLLVLHKRSWRLKKERSKQ